MDTLLFEERMTILQYLYMKTLPVIDSDIERTIKQYFDNKMIANQNNTKLGIVLINEKEELKIFYQSREEEQTNWEEILQSEYVQFKNDLIKKGYYKNKAKYNDIMGFINLFKNNEIVFKTKDLTEKKNNKGAFCQNAGKKDILKRINQILDEPVYNDDFIDQKIIITTIKPSGKINEKISNNGIYKSGLCVILELVMRFYDETNYKGLIWFLDPEMTVLNEFVDYKR